MFPLPPIKPISTRRADYDVLNEVKVTDGELAVAEMVRIFLDLYPEERALADVVRHHGDQVSRMFVGTHPDYRACDTLYHDLQHVMDVSLCMTRLMYGYEVTNDHHQRLGAPLFALGILSALYHDSGYILHKKKDAAVLTCSALTSVHVSRSQELMYQQLRDTHPYVDLIDDGSRILHYTGYERKIDKVQFKVPKLHVVGRFLGSADLLAQVADRCYLEKCRDRLFPEFVLGGMDYSMEGEHVYESARMLLVKTPIYYREIIRKRFENNLASCYHYGGIITGGFNHYAWWVERNMYYLQILINRNRLENLHRKLPDTYGQDIFPYQHMEQKLKENKNIWSLTKIAASQSGRSS